MNREQDSNNTCKICGEVSKSAEYMVKEHMFGLDESFLYFLCGNCGCLQIKEPPKDLSKYYPDNYYSRVEQAPNSHLRREMAKLRDEFYVSGYGLLGHLVSFKYPDPILESLTRLLSNWKSTRIIDVGCGYGHLLRRLHSIGFSNLLGIDPYVIDEVNIDGLRILRRTIFDVEGEFDLVMFHHSLEHMANPLQILSKAKNMVGSKGRVLIRIPTVSSYAWNHYKESWIAIDAPRHHYLFSTNSLNVLAEKTGLEVIDISYDSWPLQFWGSEQNLRGIPLMSESSHAINRKLSIFNKRQIRAFEKRTLELNRTGQGDQVAVVMKTPYGNNVDTGTTLEKA